MSFNSFGRVFRVTTFGESHGPAIGAVVEGVWPGIAFDESIIQTELDRRRPGQGGISSSRDEPDRVEVLSGIFDGKTTGAPICLLIRNTDACPDEYREIRDVFRPGHADFTWFAKYGVRDYRGGGRSSGRETVARVAAGAIARCMLKELGVEIRGYVIEAAGVQAKKRDLSVVETNPLRCPDPEAAEEMSRLIEAALADGDSVGGVVEVVADGVPAGLGDPVFEKLDAMIAAAMMSIGGVKGVEIGEGFMAARMRGSEFNDPIGPDGFESNHAGGILGGISNGAPIVVRIAVKPTPSISKPQRTIDEYRQPRVIRVHGRHDACLCPRIVPVAEAMLAIVLIDAHLVQMAIGKHHRGC